MKRNKGITLIALVITIIVLLILAGVAIAMLSGQNGILKRATDAKTETEQAQENETDHLADYEDLINESTGNLGKVKDYKNKIIEGKKAKLQDDNGETIVVPVGFKIKEDSPTEVKKGIVVVAPDNSEFVWVPVKDINTMYGTDANGKKTGKLYNFTASGHTVMTGNDYREPDYLSDTAGGDASSDGIKLLKSIVKIDGTTDEEILNKWKEQLQNEFDEMIKYVGKNKGFYVGRYETSLNSANNAQSISGVASATATSAHTWYGLYQKGKEYSEKNKITNVVGSSMIWGSQYDQMMIWMQGNGINVKSKTPTDLDGTTTSANTDEEQTTGTESKDKLNNIYDLLGNRYEWTLEEHNTKMRTARGGYCNYSNSPSYRLSDVTYGPDLTSGEYSTRLTLYIK